MIKFDCDSCKKEIKERDFKFQAQMQEIKKIFSGGGTNPTLIQRQIDLCKSCYSKHLESVLK